MREYTGVSIKTLLRLKKGEQTTRAVADKITAYFQEDELFTPVGKSSELSPKTIAHHHTLISSVLTTAVQWGVILSNPAERCKPPKVEKKQLKYYDEEQVMQMLALLEREPLKYKAAVYLAIDSGIRNGELVGLTWSNVDFNNCRLYIEQQRQYVHGLGIVTKAPKTTSGTRYVTVSERVMKLLRTYKAKQMEDRFRLGSLWAGTDIVFMHEDGSPMHPHRPYKMFKKFLEKNQLPQITFHALRHTNASLLIAQGVDVVTLSGRLGYADKSTTLRVYSHVIASQETLAANKMNDFYDRISEK